MITLIVLLGLIVAAIVYVMNIDEDPTQWANGRYATQPATHEQLIETE